MKKLIYNFISITLIFLVVFNPTSISYASEKNISNKIEFKLEKQNNFFENNDDFIILNRKNDIDVFKNIVPEIMISYYSLITLQIPIYGVEFILYNSLTKSEEPFILLMVIITISNALFLPLLNTLIIYNLKRDKKNYSFEKIFLVSLISLFIYAVSSVFIVFIELFFNNSNNFSTYFQELGIIFILPLVLTISGVIASDLSYKEKEEKEKLTKEIEELDKNMMAFSKNIKIDKNNISYTIFSF
ncbi:MAG: hypothetical protein U0457_09660 [Candidatus Sericytochromatia bacterium]